MILDVLLVVMCASIVVFFSEEIGNVLKKIFAPQWVKLFFPLAIVSWLIERYESLLLWVLLWFRGVLQQIASYLTHIIPVQSVAISSAKILVLFMMASLPLGIFYGRARYKKSPRLWAFAWFCSAMLWTFAAVLLIS